MCRALHEALPDRLDGRGARDTDPDSPFTAAWGDPAVLLGCGTATPDKLVRGSAEYDPTAPTVTADGVEWLPEQEADGIRFTTVGRKVNVQVWVPVARDAGPSDEAVAPLIDLADAVRRAVPSRL
jgi:hypothetical protein